MNARLAVDRWVDDYPLATLPLLDRLTPAFDRLPLAEATIRRCALFVDDAGAGHYLAVTTDAADSALQRWLEARSGGIVRWYLIAADDLEAWLSAQQRRQPAAPESLDSSSGEPAAVDRALAIETGGTPAGSPVVRLVNATLSDALRLGASDIHLEATGQGLAIRYRLDGVLESIRSLRGSEVASQVISRLKVLAELDIAETRIPQDGRLAIRLGRDGRRIDLRVSIMPSLHGEDAVLRILDKQHLVSQGQQLRLDSLGFAADDMTRLRALAAQPYGMLLATGPTGSGKTTSLYALLSEIHDGREKIITIEDPIEYQLPGILQIPVNEKKGLTFARGLRSILRHDPDTLMVGEIRDRETAEIAIQSALTGHRVLSTVHANHVFDVFGRFSHMGIDPYLLSSAINGLFAQRLVRRLCPACAEPCPGEPDASLPRSNTAAPPRFRRAVGCPACRGTGYRGRSAIVEILALDDTLRTLIGQRAPLPDIRAAASALGLRSLRQSALALAAEGVTSLEEVQRVTLRP